MLVLIMQKVLHPIPLLCRSNIIAYANLIIRKQQLINIPQQLYSTLYRGYGIDGEISSGNYRATALHS